MPALLRIALGCIGACLAAGLMRELANISLSGKEFALETVFEQAAENFWWAAPVGAVMLGVSEWLRARSIWFFLLAGLVLALAAAMAFNGPEILSLNEAARAAPMTPLLLTGLGGGALYWMLAGHKAGWRSEADEMALTQDRLALRQRLGELPAQRCWPCLLGGLGLAALPFLALGYWSLSEPETALGITRGAQVEADLALRQAGYGWASLKVDDEVGRIVGTAPNEAARDVAFATAQKVLAPAIGAPGIIAILKNDLAVAAATIVPPQPSISEIEARRKVEEERRRLAALDVEAKRKADEDARRRLAAEAEARRKADEDARRRLAAEAEAKRKADEDERRRLAAAEAEAKRKANEEARRAAAEAEAVRRAEAARQAVEAARAAAVAPVVPSAAPAVAPAPPVAPAPAAVAAPGGDARGSCDAAAIAAIESIRVTFDTTQADLDKPDADAVEQVVKAAGHCPGVRLEVRGHTDAWGFADYNTALSRRRAAAVRAALQARGLPGSSLVIRGYGEERPIAGNDTAEGRARNRRVDFVVLSKPLAGGAAAPAVGAAAASAAASVVAGPVTAPPAVSAAECQANLARGLADGVQFKPSSAVVDAASTKRLLELAAVARGCVGLALRVEAHTDGSGSPAANADLSVMMARAVRRILVRGGVPAAQITAQGFGATRPIDTGAGPDARPGSGIEAKQRNRRIEISVRGATPATKP